MYVWWVTKSFSPSKRDTTQQLVIITIKIMLTFNQKYDILLYVRKKEYINIFIYLYIYKTKKKGGENMNNEAVILSFLTREKAQTAKRIIPTQDGEDYYEGRTLTSDGETLINYQTAIAKHIDDKIYLNTTHYSATTTIIQKKIKQLSNEKGLQIVECKEFIEK